MKQQCSCPAAEDLCAFVDGELRAPRAEEIRLHALACPACGGLLRQFGRQRADLQQLRQRTVDTDLAAIVLARLGGLPEGRERRRPQRSGAWPRLWHAGPRALGGALAFGVGIYLGTALLAGAGTAARPTRMSAFEAERATVFCAGLPTCAPRGR